MAQQQHLRTVAGELERAIRIVNPVASNLRFVSRTDARVHAFQQVVVFDSTREIAPRGWALGLSRLLSDDLVVASASSVRVGFDPRDHVLSKTYQYRILQSQIRDPFLERRTWRIVERLNHALMEEEALALVGTHDFAAFRCGNDKRGNTERTLVRVSIEVDPYDHRLFSWVIEGDRFLMHMVRIIVGTLVDVGRGRLAPGAFRRALTSCKRRDLGMTAPASGLYLRQIQLDSILTDRWPQVDETTIVT